VVGINIRTLQRWKKNGTSDRRKGSKKHVVRKLDEETEEKILKICINSTYRDMTPHEIVPRLLDQGEYIASVSTFYRILRKNKLNGYRGNTRIRKKRNKPPERIATGPDQVWCWDITWLPRDVKGYFYYAYTILDIFNREIVGWAIHEVEDEKLAGQLFRDTVCRRDIRFEYLHSDNGNPMKGVSLRAFLKELDVKLSYSRPRVSNDNPYVESLYRTLKYKPGYPQRFRSLDEARLWMADFVYWYNTYHMHSGLDYVSPKDIRTGKAYETFKNRNKVMARAMQENPQRWGCRAPKIWGNSTKVYLNKEK
jgi:transposase InsO family protein